MRIKDFREYHTDRLTHRPSLITAIHRYESHLSHIPSVHLDGMCCVFSPNKYTTGMRVLSLITAKWTAGMRGTTVLCLTKRTPPYFIFLHVQHFRKKLACYSGASHTGRPFLPLCGQPGNEILLQAKMSSACKHI